MYPSSGMEQYIQCVRIHSDCITSIPCVHAVTIQYIDNRRVTTVMTGDTILNLVKTVPNTTWMIDATSGNLPWVSSPPITHFNGYEMSDISIVEKDKDPILAQSDHSHRVNRCMNCSIL